MKPRAIAIAQTRNPARDAMLAALAGLSCLAAAIAASPPAVGQVFSGIPSVDTKKVSTQVLVDNGDTIVLGGIFEQTTRTTVDKVPFLGDVPVIGHLFKRTVKQDDKTELLIFVTPKIVKDALSVR